MSSLLEPSAGEPAVASSAVAFAAVQAALGLFAEAIAGEPVLFESAEQRAGWPWQPSLWSRNAAASSTVVMPAVLDVHESGDANRRAGRAMILHQLLAQRARGDVAVLIKAERPSPAVQAIWAMVEDLRIDAETCRRFPGAAADLHALLTRARRHEQQNEHRVTGAVGALRLRSLGASRSEVGDACADVISDMVDFIVGETGRVLGVSSPADSLAVARRLATAIATGLFPPVHSVENDADQSAPPAGAPTDESGSGIPSAGGTPSDYEQGAGLSHGQAATDGAAIAEPDAGDEKPTTGLTVESLATRTEQAPRSFIYDEWDYLRQQHRPGWCRVLEETLRGDDHEFIGDVRDRYRDLRRQIRESFTRLRPTDLVRVHRCDDGDEIDLDAAIEARIDRRSGAPADDRVHSRRDRGARDVATAFLIDLSASTSSPAVTPEPAPLPPAPDPYDDILSYAPIWAPGEEVAPERRVIDVALDSVALMSDALHELGDRHALYGFSGTGRHGVEFKVAKDFTDRVSPATWAALAAMKPLRYTRMGPAIRHAASKLAAQTARTRLLIAISDGYPQDVDYGDDPRDREYGVQDTASALADAARAGIDTFCVTIDPAGHDYLREMMPADRYAIIDDVEALPAVLPQLYLNLAGS